jgi:WXXGXW repeat (2 copies)
MSANGTSLKLQLRRGGLAIGLVALALGSAFVVPPQPAHAAAVAVGVTIGPTRAPPPLRHEMRPRRPHPGWYWQPGYWSWHDGGYVWVAGVWVKPPRTGASWVSGHWVHRHRQYVWVAGHWR